MPKILEIVGDFTEDYELFAPIQCLEMLGYEVHVVCPDKREGEKIRTAIHQVEDGVQTYVETFGHTYTLNYSWDRVKLDDYVGIIIPGGRAPEYLRYNKSLQEFVRAAFKQNKPVAAICHGLQILAAANVLKDRTISAFPMCEFECVAAGAKYVDYPAFSKEAHTDGNLVTAPAWPAIGVWLKQFLKVLNVQVTGV